MTLTLSEDKRLLIARLSAEGMSSRAIARYMGCCFSTAAKVARAQGITKPSNARKKTNIQEEEPHPRFTVDPSAVSIGNHEVQTQPCLDTRPISPLNRLLENSTAVPMTEVLPHAEEPSKASAIINSDRLCAPLPRLDECDALLLAHANLPKSRKSADVNEDSRASEATCKDEEYVGPDVCAAISYLTSLGIFDSLSMNETPGAIGEDECAQNGVKSYTASHAEAHDSLSSGTQDSTTNIHAQAEELRRILTGKLRGRSCNRKPTRARTSKKRCLGAKLIAH